MTGELSTREFQICNNDTIRCVCARVCEIGAGVTTTPAKWCVQLKRHICLPIETILECPIIRYCGAADGANDEGCPLFEGIRAPRRPTYNYTSPDFHWLIAQQQVNESESHSLLAFSDMKVQFPPKF